jgi:hypothetical protein
MQSDLSKLAAKLSDEQREAVLTFPEGNPWLDASLAEFPHAGRTG